MTANKIKIYKNKINIFSWWPPWRIMTDKKQSTSQLLELVIELWLNQKLESHFITDAETIWLLHSLLLPPQNTIKTMEHIPYNLILLSHVNHVLNPVLNHKWCLLWYHSLILNNKKIVIVKKKIHLKKKLYFWDLE